LPLSKALDCFNRWGGQPLPISASVWWRDQAWLRLSGAQAAVGAARTRLGGELLEPQAADALWRSLREQTHEFFRGSAALWRLSLPSTAPALADETTQLIEWGGALRWCASAQPPAHWRALAAGAGGTALHWRGGEAGQRFHPLSSAVLQLHRRLKARLDPHGIFNPGRLVAGL
jgi:glycolate oxidase FAD binding subunit